MPPSLLGVDYIPNSGCTIEKSSTWDRNNLFTVELEFETTVQFSNKHRRCCWARTVANSILASTAEIYSPLTSTNKTQCVETVTKHLQQAQQCSEIKGVADVPCRRLTYENSFPAYLQLPHPKTYTIECSGKFSLTKAIDTRELKTEAMWDHFPPFLYQQPSNPEEVIFTAKGGTYFKNGVPNCILLLEKVASSGEGRLCAEYAPFDYRIEYKVTAEVGRLAQVQTGFNVFTCTSGSDGSYTEAWNYFSAETASGENITNVRLYSVFPELSNDYTSANEGAAVKSVIDRLRKASRTKRPRGEDVGRGLQFAFQVDSRPHLVIASCPKENENVVPEKTGVFENVLHRLASHREV
ncbi:hypothetical protein ADEAN_000422300 [Angomonas deanei]|uniref:Uncharacterized protein n=1 Tax=Angomonas deanei TaxID=59799 RepID=A0A7G2CA57_9TRYP|nr:hypothetical protein ADEAN_000422300 [Angomonas deanei]